MYTLYLILKIIILGLEMLRKIEQEVVIDHMEFEGKTRQKRKLFR